MLGEKAKIASLLVETQQRKDESVRCGTRTWVVWLLGVSEETQSAREMAREQTEKVLHEMEELKNK